MSDRQFPVLDAVRAALATLTQTMHDRGDIPADVVLWLPVDIESQAFADMVDEKHDAGGRRGTPRVAAHRCCFNHRRRKPFAHALGD